jgi:CRP-like cAMP-binding protein
VKGIIKKKRNNKEGKEFIIEFGGRSFLSGLGEAVSGFPVEGSTITVTPVTALRIPAPDIQFLLRNNQFFSNEVNHFLARKTIYLYEFMSELVFSPVRNRLSSNLIRLAEVLRENGNKGFIPLGQFDLAAYTGTTRETVSRVLNDLEEEKLLEMGSNQVQILNLEKLKEIAYMYT